VQTDAMDHQWDTKACERTGVRLVEAETGEDIVATIRRLSLPLRQQKKFNITV
jgi:hypothetical protein